MLYRLLYLLLLKAVSISFNILNLRLAGNLAPFATVCVVVEEHGRYLVIEKSSSSFTLPGGFIRWRENPAQATLRECEEETGLRVKLGEIVGYHATVSNRFDSMSTLNITYEATIVCGQLRGSVEGQPCWRSEIELRGKLTPYSVRILEDYQRYRLQHGNQSPLDGDGIGKCDHR